MNINLGDAAEGWHHETIQDEIDEHVSIMITANLNVGTPVMLLPDPEYPGVYRVWTRLLPKEGTIESAAAYRWVWVTPDGEVITSAWPWSVTD